MRKTGSIFNCLNCSKEMYVPVWAQKQGCGKSCSRKCQYELRIKVGWVPWNTGKKRPFAKRKMKPGFLPDKAFKKGLIPWNKGKEGLQIAWNKGTGISTEEQRIRYSNEYRKWRKEVLKRDKHKCVMCGSEKKLEVDHIKPFALFPELRIELTNGRTLCLCCHKKTETYGGRKMYA